MADVKHDGASIDFEFTSPLVIVGGGASGIVAGLAAMSKGIDAVILERDAQPQGSTFMSSGFIPAAGTRFQKSVGITDNAEKMTNDILNKNNNEADPAIVSVLAQSSAEVIEWLADEHQIPFELVQGFLYPGHSEMRMHCTPHRTGQELMSCLLNAAEKIGLPILTEAKVTTLHVDNNHICGVSFERRDGSIEQVGCGALLLACNGFGGNPQLVEKYIPEMKSGIYFGHEGNQGEAILWGKELNASLKDLGSYQGHGSLAYPHLTLISWAVMMHGGIQINKEGKRFSNENGGYSEQAAKVTAQTDGIAFNIYDSRIHEQCLIFEDYINAQESGAVKVFNTIEGLSTGLNLPLISLLETFNEIERYQAENKPDAYGRTFNIEQNLKSPYYAIQVTGALFHTQGGLEIDTTGRVLNKDGNPFPNLFAVGGAARGVSGKKDYGYLSGNGLLSAVVMGAIAGKEIADIVALSPNVILP